MTLVQTRIRIQARPVLDPTLHLAYRDLRLGPTPILQPAFVNGDTMNGERIAMGVVVDPLALLGEVPVPHAELGTRPMGCFCCSFVFNGSPHGSYVLLPGM